MIKIIAVALAIMILAVMPSGCGVVSEPDGGGNSTAPDNGNITAGSGGGKINVVCTIFPQYDWVRQIIGDKTGNYDITLLLNNRIDLHSYQPPVDDIAKISTCDLFIYVGGISDNWVENALKGAINKKMAVINLMDALGGAVKAEELIEGMEDEVDEGEGDGDGDDENDEHVWLSLKNARILCSVIAEQLSFLDEANKNAYETNLARYDLKLTNLDGEYQSTVNAVPAGAAGAKTLLFGDRYPFRYLFDDYGLKAYAAFPGCSAETDASFETVIFLAEKMNELGLTSIFVTESSDKKIAETIINNTSDKNQRILTLDSMQSVTSNDAENGAKYISIMESNLEALKEALK